MTRVFIEFERGRVTLEQALRAVRANEYDNARYFLGQAERVIEGVSETGIPVSPYREAISDGDPAEALVALGDLAEFVTSYEGDEYQFTYEEDDITALESTIQTVC